MRVLVTNDDGVEAPGLHALAAAMHGAGHEVVVVAPSGQCSGSGAAIGRLHRAGPIAWQEVAWPDLPGVPVHSVDLPPAGAVYAGCLGAFGPAPEVVASGVNPGLNHGHLVLHSGTVGAALTARVMGMGSVAVSLQWHDEQRWETAATLAVGAAVWAAETASPTVVNLSVPNVALDDVRGVREATLAPFAERWTATTKPGELLLEYDGQRDEPPEGSDFGLVKAGYAAVTLLSGITADDRGSSGAADAVAAMLAPDAAA